MTQDSPTLERHIIILEGIKILTAIATPIYERHTIPLEAIIDLTPDNMSGHTIYLGIKLLLTLNLITETPDHSYLTWIGPETTEPLPIILVKAMSDTWPKLAPEPKP